MVQFTHDTSFSDYNWKSGEFSTWTESSWATDAIELRFFLIPSKQFEVRI